VSIPGATTTVVNTLVVAIVVHSTDLNGSAEASLWTNANLSDLNERADSYSAIGGGGGYALATGVKVAAGAYGATTATLVTSSLQGRMSIALRPPPCGVISDLSFASASSATSGAPHSVTLTFPSSEVIVLRKTSAFTASDAPLYTYASTFTLAGGPNGTDLISNSGSPITSVTDNNNGSGLTAGTKYFYKVIAKAGSC